MKHLLLIFGIIIFSSPVYSQEEKNVYVNHQEFKDDTPSAYCDFKIKHRTSGNVFMMGGITNYRIKKVKPESANEWMTNTVWGVKFEDSLYINSIPYSGIIGYNRILEVGFYSYFIGEPARQNEFQVNVGIIEEGEKSIQVCCKTGYVILPDGSIKWLHPELLKALVSDQPDLLAKVESQEFKPEDTIEMFEILSEYNKLINSSQ